MSMMVIQTSPNVVVPCHTIENLYMLARNFGFPEPSLLPNKEGVSLSDVNPDEVVAISVLMAPHFASQQNKVKRFCDAVGRQIQDLVGPRTVTVAIYTAHFSEVVSSLRPEKVAV